MVAGHVQCRKRSSAGSGASEEPGIEPFTSLYKSEPSAAAVESADLETWEERLERDEVSWLKMSKLAVGPRTLCRRLGRQAEITPDTLNGLP